VDGRDLQDDVSKWQRIIGYVPQDVYLMDETVRRNVAFGLPDREIADERIWKALRAAQLDGLVRSLPGGLDAMVGERGNRLSGGECQRLGIARALYHDPQVLVVDEGTANLDNETEAAIVRTLARLRGEKTIIVVAHRFRWSGTVTGFICSSRGDCRIPALMPNCFRQMPGFASLPAARVESGVLAKRPRCGDHYAGFSAAFRSCGPGGCEDHRRYRGSTP